MQRAYHKSPVSQITAHPFNAVTVIQEDDCARLTETAKQVVKRFKLVLTCAFHDIRAYTACNGAFVKIVKALGIQDSEVPLIAVGSRLDAAKGEALVLLSAFDVEMSKLRRLLTEAGLPNLWIPKYLVRIDSIPLLSSGKLDLGKIRKLCAAEESSV